MNDLQIFKNEEFGGVRTIEIESKPYFMASDIAKALGYTNPQKAIRDHCKGVNESFYPTNGGEQKANFIPEGDIYRLITRSQLPSAEKFETWVFDEVLPSIRKHGMYATDELLDNPDLLIQVATALKEAREKNKLLTFEVKVKDQQIIEMQPKATYYDLILQCPGLLSMTEISKDYGKSAKWMNKKLHELAIQYNQSDVWFLYQKYAGYGYTQTKTHNYPDSTGTQQSKVHMYWTQKGRLFVYEVLKKQGIVPTTEREVL